VGTIELTCLISFVASAKQGVTLVIRNVHCGCPPQFSRTVHVVQVVGLPREGLYEISRLHVTGTEMRGKSGIMQCMLWARLKRMKGSTAC